MFQSKINKQNYSWTISSRNQWMENYLFTRSQYAIIGTYLFFSCTAKHGSKECEHQARSYLILPPVQSARINTLHSFTFRYGIVEIIARLPVGDWLIPGINKSFFYIYYFYFFFNTTRVSSVNFWLMCLRPTII